MKFKIKLKHQILIAHSEPRAHSDMGEWEDLKWTVASSFPRCSCAPDVTVSQIFFDRTVVTCIPPSLDDDINIVMDVFDLLDNTFNEVCPVYVSRTHPNRYLSMNGGTLMVSTRAHVIPQRADIGMGFMSSTQM